MPDDYSYDDDQDDDDDATNTVTLSRNQIRTLEKRAKASDAAMAKAAAAERELAFYRAGVPDTPATKYFVKGYDGENTPEAIRAAAVEAGFLEADTTAAPMIGAAERDSYGRVAEASAGAFVPPPGADIEADLAAAKSPEDVYAVMVKHGQWTERG